MINSPTRSQPTGVPGCSASPFSCSWDRASPAAPPCTGDVFNGILVVSNFSKAAGLIILACGLFTALSSQSYFKQNSFCTTEYYSLTVFAASGMLLLTMAQELITVFIALEIMSLAIYILVGYDRKNVISTEALLKYLMLGAFAGSFLVMGSALVYGAAGSTKFPLIGQYLSTHAFLQSPAIIGGAFFILVAFLFKAAAFRSMPGWWMSMTVPPFPLPATWPPL